MKKVTTPDGRMPAAGLFRPLCALFIDVLVITLVILAVLGLVERAGYAIAPSAGWIPGLLAFGYGFLAHRHKVPSLGNWSLALRRYPYSSLEEFSGKGTLLLVEQLPASVRARRLITVFITVGVLFTLFIGI